MQFSPLSSETAPSAARPLLAGTQAKFGFVPSPVAKAAASPVALKHLFAGFAAFDQSSLSSIEREVVAMTVAFENGCAYCMALHSAQLADSPLLPALRAGTALPDAKLEALRLFTRDLVRTRGRADAAPLAAAGYTEQNALDIVLGVGVYVLSTYLNILTACELDPAFAAFAWTKPS